ncbi:MAG: hypothetical protein COB33_004085 [Thiotrichaceae bacterium]|nr:hypothetical protein [Thiotrichaceae bacterium]
MSIYIAARDLDGMVPIGTHQFIIIDGLSNPYESGRLENKIISPKNLGNGKLGYVIGAHNRGNLEAIFFEKSDYEATLEYFDRKRVSFFKSDFDTEVIKVKFPNADKKVATSIIIRIVNAYSVNQSMDKIAYPPLGFGFNSNSWAQTVIELAGGVVQSDLKGVDISNKKRIPRTYFMSVCPEKPRPKIN